MPLTDLAIRNAKPREKLYKLYDGRGLCLELHPNGSRYWRYRYRYSGKDKRIALGVHPEVSLADARESADDKRKALRSGIDPAAERKAEKRRVRAATENSFENVAREWLENQSGRWSANHLVRIRHSLEVDVFPFLGSRPIAAVTAPDLLPVLRAIERRNALATD